MRTQDLLVVLVPQQWTHLTLSIYRINQLPRLYVPEFHCLIRRTSACCQEVSLPWAPGKSLDSGFMPWKLVLYLTGSNVPNHCEVIIAARSKPTGIVFEPTNFPSVPLKLKHNIMRWPDIMADNFGVSWSCEQEAISEGRWGDTTGMAFKSSD